MSWSVARSFCTQHDMEFVYFDSLAESVQYLSFKPNHYWIGITDASVEGSFSKYSGTRTSQNSLLRWGLGEPNNAGGNENCVEVVTDYNDNDCAKFFQGGCMRKIQ